ncbi:MAG: hypothetical protein HY321_08135 [Armatimonadetes bacterium]|nr:hypothetical protein [Armatimonadota bacterium]
MKRHAVVRMAASLVLGLVGVLGLAPSAWGQVLGDAAPPNGLIVTNEYIGLGYLTGGSMPTIAQAGPDGNPAGRWAVGTVGGDPTTPDDDNRLAIGWSFLAYQVDPQLALQAGQWYRVGSGGGGSRYTVGPFVDSAAKVIWGTWQDQRAGIKIEERLSIVRDMVRAEYKFTNVGGANHRVRARFFFDAPDGGTWVVRPRNILVETEYSPGNMPEDWRYYAPLDDPELVIRGILTRFGATVPSKFQIARGGALAGAPWNYAVNPDLYVDADLGTNGGCAPYYETFSLLPGQTKTLVAYVGLGVAETDPSPPYVLAVQAPRTLGFALRDDPSTPEPETSFPYPRTFDIEGFFYNTSEYDISGAAMFLNLPKGLSLLPGEQAARNLGSVLRGQEARASWRVRVDSGYAGTLAYTVSSSGVPVPSKTLMGTIEIPAQTVRPFDAGLQFISVPFQFANPDTAVALNMAADRIRMARWDPATKKYAYYPDSFLAMVQAGAGYWFRPDLPVTLSLTGASPVPRTTASNYVIPIKSGWNMIGCPFVYPVPWSSARVSDGREVLTLAEATQAGWVRPTLFSYNTSDKSYTFDAVENTLLEPWKGYWLHALHDGFLVIPPVTTPGAELDAPDQRARSQSGWRIQLAARTRSAADLANFAGVSRGVSDGFGLEDVEEPPVPGEGYVSLRFLPADGSRSAGAVTQDIRGDDFSTAKVWEFEVDTDQAGETVTLSWPRLNAILPEALSATLEDVSTGRRVYLRNQGAYEFQASADGPRRFRLEVARRAGGLLTITNVEVSPAGGRAGARSISFQLSGRAVADVRVLSPTGRVIREVSARKAVDAGRSAVVWDGTDSRGAQLTSGVVLVEVTATAPEGNSVRVIQPVVLVR